MTTVSLNPQGAEEDKAALGSRYEIRLRLDEVESNLYIPMVFHINHFIGGLDFRWCLDLILWWFQCMQTFEIMVSCMDLDRACPQKSTGCR